MEIIAVVIYILTICIGFSAVVLFALVYLKLRHTVLKYYSVFLALMLMLMVQGYAETWLHQSRWAGGGITKAMYFYLYLWGMLFVRYLPRFFFALLGLSMPRPLVIATAAGALIQILTPVLIIMVHHSSPEFHHFLISGLQWIWVPLICLTMIYSAAVLVIHRHLLRDPLKSRILRIILVLTAVFSPAIITDILQPTIWKAVPLIPFGFKFSTLYFIAWNIISFRIVYRHFFPRYQLTKSFCASAQMLENIGITPRELNIIENLAKGLTLAQTAENLNISYKTVDNHVSNIYKKAGVQSRQDLLKKLT